MSQSEQKHSNHPKIDLPTQSASGKFPFYASCGASGADVEAFIQKPVIIAPGTAALVPTGIRFAIPEGYEIQVRPRSGLALKNQIFVLNTPGTIDADYRGDVNIILFNLGKEPFIVTPGMRIAQLVLAPVLQANFVNVDALMETARGAGGFGSTGTH